MRSFKVTQGQRFWKTTQKVQISTFLENGEIWRQHEALEINIKNMYLSRSFKVTQVQKSRKSVKNAFFFVDSYQNKAVDFINE